MYYIMPHAIGAGGTELVRNIKKTFLAFFDFYTSHTKKELFPDSFTLLASDQNSQCCTPKYHTVYYICDYFSKCIATFAMHNTVFAN